MTPIVQVDTRDGEIRVAGRDANLDQRSSVGERVATISSRFPTGSNSFGKSLILSTIPFRFPKEPQFSPHVKRLRRSSIWRQVFERDPSCASWACFFSLH
jgi:hypothetical protein